MTKQERERLREQFKEVIEAVRATPRQASPGSNMLASTNIFVVAALLDQIDALEGQIAEFQPIDAIPIEDCDEGTDKRYGRVLISTENCIQTLYRKAAIASATEGKNNEG